MSDKNIAKLEAEASRVNAQLRAARRDKKRREREAYVSACCSLGERVAGIANADTPEAVSALCERLDDDALRSLVKPSDPDGTSIPASPDEPQWGSADGYAG